MSWQQQSTTFDAKPPVQHQQQTPLHHSHPHQLPAQSPTASHAPSVSASQTTSPVEGGAGPPRKRKRSSVAGNLLNGGGGDEGGDGEETGSPSTANRARHQPGVKRACNECRQQKLRCDVQAGSPGAFKPCSRCIKHNLTCSIDSEFKRLGKRAEHNAIVRELDEMKNKVAQFEALGYRLPDQPQNMTPNYGSDTYHASPSVGSAPVAPMANNSSYLGPSEAAASRSLLDLSQGYRDAAHVQYPSITPGTSTRALGGVVLSDEQVEDLFNIYFSSYHQFLPVLDPNQDYSVYYKMHPLLHWTIIAVAARRYDSKPGLLIELQHPLTQMLWTSLSQVPQIYHICKALALLCTWPLPTSSTSQDPTMMLSGVMFQLAMQYGLHRPSHAQDFMRFRVDLQEVDIADRLNTWAAVNIVAQNVATGQGQPPLSRWAWFTYGIHLDRMRPELKTRCQIEKYVDQVTKALFTMQRDHIVEVDTAQRGLTAEMFGREIAELELTVLSTGGSAVDLVFLKAAALHLRLHAFFDKPTHPSYLADLRSVYITASSLLNAVIDLDQAILLHIPRYIEQMVLAAGVTLLKLLNSFYSSHVDMSAGRALFGKCVNTLRRLSVISNDLPQRLAEVLAQLWQRSGGSEQRNNIFTGQGDGTVRPQPPDGSLQLQVRCRSSLSVLYDSIWRWREQTGDAGTNALQQAVEHPTRITGDSTNTSGTPNPQNPHHNNPQAHAPHLQPGLGVPANTTGVGGLGATGGLGNLPGDGLDSLTWDDSFGGNAVFDPLSWALDGDLRLPFGNGGGDLGF